MSRSEVRFYVLGGSPAPWGDLGGVLMHGMAEHAPDCTLLLYRTGPFVPPISFPFPSVVVTQAVREQMEGQGFSGFEFRRVSKRRIVRLDWHEWDLEAQEQDEYPEQEPEDYILRGKHSAATAREVGELWEIWVPETPGLQIEGGYDFDPALYAGQDFCCGGRWGCLYVSERVREWLETSLGRWVRLDAARPYRGV